MGAVRSRDERDRFRPEVTSAPGHRRSRTTAHPTGDLRVARLTGLPYVFGEARFFIGSGRGSGTRVHNGNHGRTAARTGSDHE